MAANNDRGYSQAGGGLQILGAVRQRERERCAALVADEVDAWMRLDVPGGDVDIETVVITLELLAKRITDGRRPLRKPTQ